MAWKKIVKLVAVATCPNCGNHGFNMKFHPTGDEVRPDDKVECAACGHVCRGGAGRASSQGRLARRRNGERQTQPGDLVDLEQAPVDFRQLLLDICKLQILNLSIGSKAKGQTLRRQRRPVHATPTALSNRLISVAVGVISPLHGLVNATAQRSAR